MGVAISLLLVLQIVVCLLIVLIVLMQRPKQEGLGAAFGGGMASDAFGAQATNVLQKITVWLAVIFFVNSLVMSVLYAKKNREANITAAPPVEKPEGVENNDAGAGLGTINPGTSAEDSSKKLQEIIDKARKEAEAKANAEADANKSGTAPKDGETTDPKVEEPKTPAGGDATTTPEPKVEEPTTTPDPKLEETTTPKPSDAGGETAPAENAIEGAEKDDAPGTTTGDEPKKESGE